MATRQYTVDGAQYSAQEIIHHFGAKSERPAQLRDAASLRILGPHFPQIKRLLDVGSYLGDFIVHLKRRYPSVDCVGVDYYEDSIEVAKLIHPEHKGLFQIMSTYKLDFPDGAFDCVTFKEVIEHIDRPSDALKEINRVLSPGGLLLVSTPNANARAWELFPLSLYGSMLALIGKKKAPKQVVYFDAVEWNRHIYAWTAKTLATLLHVNGFEYVSHSFYTSSLLGRLFPEMGDGLIFLVQKVRSPGKTI